jgi:hypothetical protein
VQSLYSAPLYASIALHTALGLILASLASLFARPSEGIMGVITSATPAGDLVRRLMPAIVVIPVLLGWITLEGQRARYYDTNFGVALLVAGPVGPLVLHGGAHRLLRISAAVLAAGSSHCRSSNERPAK